MKKLFLLALILALPASIIAAPFTPGDIAVYRDGDGGSALSSAAAAIFIDEYTPSGTLVQSIAAPSTGAAELTGSGTASSEGELNLSTNGQFLVFGGYGADAGTVSVVSSSAARVIGEINVGSGALDTSTRLTSSTTYTGNNFRGVASQDGTSFWLAGTGSSSGNEGVRYATLGATSSTTIETGVTNIRGVGIYNGQLYGSSGSSSTYGIYSIGTGVPTTSGQTATQLPPGSEFTASVAYTGFYLSPDGTRLFVATGAATNSIQEFVLNAGTWSLDKSLAVANSFQLTGTTTGGVTTLFYTLNAGTAGNTLNTVSFDSTADAFGTPLTLATAGANETFKGVALILPVPEPSTTAALLFAAGAWIAYRFLRARKSRLAHGRT